jgi:hypothetical protein
MAPADKARRRKPPWGLRRRRRRRRRFKPDAGIEGRKAKDPDKVAIKDPKNPEEKKKKYGPPGKLRLHTNPWTDIYFNGRKLGQTPLVDVELPSGLIKLRAVNKEAGIDRTIFVKIKPGQTNVHRQNLF